MFNNTSFAFVMYTTLLFLIFICIPVEQIYYKDYYRNATASTYHVINKYLGVTVMVSLKNGSMVYCMGFFVNDVHIPFGVEFDYKYVLTSASCLDREGFSSFSVRISYAGIRHVYDCGKIILLGSKASFQWITQDESPEIVFLK